MLVLLLVTLPSPTLATSSCTACLTPPQTLTPTNDTLHPTEPFSPLADESHHIPYGEFFLNSQSLNHTAPDGTRTALLGAVLDGAAILQPMSTRLVEAVMFQVSFQPHLASWAHLPAVKSISLSIWSLNSFDKIVLNEPLQLQSSDSSDIVTYSCHRPFILYALITPEVYRFELQWIFKEHPFPVPYRDIPDYPWITFELVTDPSKFSFSFISAPLFNHAPRDRYGVPTDSHSSLLVNIRPYPLLSIDDGTKIHVLGVKASSTHHIFSPLDITFPLGDWMYPYDNPEDRVDGISLKVFGQAFVTSPGLTRVTCKLNNNMSLEFEELDSTWQSRSQTYYATFSPQLKLALRLSFNLPINTIRIMCNDLFLVTPSDLVGLLKSTTVVEIAPFYKTRWTYVERPLQRGAHVQSITHPTISSRDILIAPELTTFNILLERNYSPTVVAPISLTRTWSSKGDPDSVILSTEFQLNFNMPHNLGSYLESSGQFPDGLDLTQSVIRTDDPNARVFVVAWANNFKHGMSESEVTSVYFNTTLANWQPFFFDTAKLFSIDSDSDSYYPMRISVSIIGKINETALFRDTVPPLMLFYRHSTTQAYNNDPRELYEPKRSTAETLVSTGIASCDVWKLRRQSDPEPSWTWEMAVDNPRWLNFRMKFHPINTDSDDEESIGSMMVSLPGWQFCYDEFELERMLEQKLSTPWLKLYSKRQLLHDSNSLNVKLEIVGANVLLITFDEVWVDYISVNVNLITFCDPNLSQEAPIFAEGHSAPIGTPNARFPMHLAVNVGYRIDSFFNLHGKPSSIALDYNSSHSLTSCGRSSLPGPMDPDPVPAPDPTPAPAPAPVPVPVPVPTKSSSLGLIIGIVSGVVALLLLGLVLWFCLCRKKNKTKKSTVSDSKPIEGAYIALAETGSEYSATISQVATPAKPPPPSTPHPTKTQPPPPPPSTPYPTKTQPPPPSSPHPTTAPQTYTPYHEPTDQDEHQYQHTNAPYIGREESFSLNPAYNPYTQ